MSTIPFLFIDELCSSLLPLWGAGRDLDVASRFAHDNVGNTACTHLPEASLGDILDWSAAHHDGCTFEVFRSHITRSTEEANSGFVSLGDVRRYRRKQWAEEQTRSMVQSFDASLGGASATWQPRVLTQHLIDHCVVDSVTMFAFSDQALDVEALAPQLLSLYIGMYGFEVFDYDFAHLKMDRELHYSYLTVSKPLDFQMLLAMAREVVRKHWPLNLSNTLWDFFSLSALLPYQFRDDRILRPNRRLSFRAQAATPPNDDPPPVSLFGPRIQELLFTGYAVVSHLAQYPTTWQDQSPLTVDTSQLKLLSLCSTSEEARQRVTTIYHRALRRLQVDPAEQPLLADQLNPVFDVRLPLDDPTRCITGRDCVVYLLDKFPLCASRTLLPAMLRDLRARVWQERYSEVMTTDRYEPLSINKWRQQFDRPALKNYVSVVRENPGSYMLTEDETPIGPVLHELPGLKQRGRPYGFVRGPRFKLMKLK